MVPVSQGPSTSLICEDGGCGQHEAKITELVKALGDCESRLRNLEDATTRASSCQCSHGSFKKVNKDLTSAKDALEHEKLQSQQRLEEHKTSAKAQYQALEAKFNNLACEVKELPSLPVHWEMVARVEELEQKKRWNERVRQLKAFVVATPEPVLRHLEYLESRLNTVLYDRHLPLTT